MREITVAKNAGFCFGVKRAADSIEKAISSSKGERIYTLGHLIHNPTFNKRLEDKGVRAVEFAEVEDIARSATADSPVKLFLRAHGVPLCEEEKLRELICSAYRSVSEKAVSGILKNMNISMMIEEKINEMQTEDLEKMVLAVMKKELDTIVNLGAFVGGILGILNMFF